MRNGTTLLGAQTKRPVIGAGGWATGIDAAQDGTFVMRTDTYGGYITAPNLNGPWVQQFVADSTIALSDVDVNYMPDGSNPDPYGQMGTYCEAIAWNESSVRYFGAMGYIFVKKFGASTYTKTALPQRLGMAPNEGQRMSGHPLDVDPANYRVVWFGSPQGVFFSQDQGDTWTTVSTATLPAPTAGQRTIIRFDRNSAVVGTGAAARTQRIIIFIPGSGLYQSTNAGSTWAAMTNRPTSPTVASHMKINPANGHIFLSGAGGEAESVVSRWNGTAWNESGHTAKTVAISPHVAGLVYSIGAGGALCNSIDGGATWSADISSFTVGTFDVAWHSVVEGYRSVGEAEFSPISNVLVFSGGIGAWKVPNPPATLVVFNSNPTINGFSLGNESMVMSGANFAPDGTLGLSMHDRSNMIIPFGKAGLVHASNYGPPKGSGSAGLVHGMGTPDWAPEDNAFWIANHTYENTEVMGYTPDRGATWTQVNNLKNLSTGRGGGQSVCLSKDVVICGQLSSFGPFGAATKPKNALYLTTNFRDAVPTWTEVQIGNGNAIDVARSYNTFRRTLVKDRYTTGNLRKVMFFNASDVDNPGSADSLACRGFWTIEVNMTTGAFTVTRNNDTLIWPSNTGTYSVKLNQIGPDDWMMCAGDNSMGLKRSIDGGATWNAVTGTDSTASGNRFTEVYGCSMGKKPAWSTADHRLYAIGYRYNSDIVHDNVHSHFGLWASDDDGVYWERLMGFVDGKYDGINDMVADPYRFGRLVVNYGGTGATHINLNDYTLRAS